MASSTLELQQIDPLRSPVLQSEFPGLTAAFDMLAMRTYLQDVLCDSQQVDATIAECDLDQATYLPEDGCMLRYLLTVDNHTQDQPQQVLVSGRLFPDRQGATAYLQDSLMPFVERMVHHETGASFARPIELIEPLHMVIAVYPIDPELPTLMEVTDRRRMADVLRATLPGTVSPGITGEDCQVELVDYGRRLRCTLRYRVAEHALHPGAAGDLVVYGKLTGDGSGAFAQQVSIALREQVARLNTTQAIEIPRAFAWLPELRLSLLEAIPGQALIPDALKARLRAASAKPGTPALEDMIDVCALVAAALHTSEVRLGPRRAFEDELAVLHQELEPVQRYAPDLGAYLLHWMDQLVAYAQQSEPLKPCFNHGDFTHGQFLFAGTTSGMVDFDSICQAEPALDLAQFLTYLQLAGLKSKIAPAAAQALINDVSTRFLRTYCASAGLLGADIDRLRSRIAVYQGVSLLRRVLRSWQKFKPSRITSTLGVLEDAMLHLPISR